MQVQDLNYASLPWIQQTDSVCAAIHLMEDEQLSQLPVVDGTKYLGVLSMDVLLNAEDDSALVQQLLHLLPKPSIRPEDHF